MKKTNAKRGEREREREKNERERERERERKREKERMNTSGWRVYFRESRTSVQGIEGSTASWYT